MRKDEKWLLAELGKEVETDCSSVKSRVHVHKTEKKARRAPRKAVWSLACTVAAAACATLCFLISAEFKTLQTENIGTGKVYALPGGGETKFYDASSDGEKDVFSLVISPGLNSVYYLSADNALAHAVSYRTFSENADCTSQTVEKDDKVYYEIPSSSQNGKPEDICVSIYFDTGTFLSCSRDIGKNAEGIDETACVLDFTLFSGEISDAGKKSFSYAVTEGEISSKPKFFLNAEVDSLDSALNKLNLDDVRIIDGYMYGLKFSCRQTNEIKSLTYTCYNVDDKSGEAVTCNYVETPTGYTTQAEIFASLYDRSDFDYERTVSVPTGKFSVYCSKESKSEALRSYLAIAEIKMENKTVYYCYRFDLYEIDTSLNLDSILSSLKYYRTSGEKKTQP